MTAGVLGEEMRLRHDNNPTAAALFGIAAIQLLAGLVGLFIYRSNPDIDMPELRWFLYHFQSGTFTPLDWVVAFSGAFYALLAFVAHRVRLPAALVGAGLYAGLLVLQGAAAIRDALVMKVLVVLLLATAVALAFRRRLPSPLPPGQTR